MKVVPLIKTDKLFEYLDYEVKNALHNRGVLPLGGYAWKNEDTPSDQYIGLAMWELASPEASLYAGGASQPEDLRRKLIALETTGEDLRGLMEMARKSEPVEEIWTDW